jgi:hypothetical protein
VPKRNTITREMLQEAVLAIRKLLADPAPPMRKKDRSRKEAFTALHEKAQMKLKEGRSLLAVLEELKR